MKSGFYLKTARTNILKNYRFYIPGMLTGMGLQACFYIVLTLATDERIQECKGGAYLPFFMGVGTFVISVLSLILILYTNSFLMRRRKSEYGLYNVLGLEKKHIGKIMFCESLISSSVSVLSGLALGILFYKLCSLLICRLLKSDIILGFDYIKAEILIPSGLFFCLLYFIAFLSNRLTLRKLNPSELFLSANAGEREPRVKWPMFVAGILTLGSGYCMAVFTKKPSAAILLFMLAVILVIIGTYFLFTSGSIFVLKCLKKNRRFYYGKNHISLVSGLLFRMKQNAVGLSSICILATGVLVMISSTVSLYSGMQETLANTYNRDAYLAASYKKESDTVWTDFSYEELSEVLGIASEKTGLELKETLNCEYLTVAYPVINGKLVTEGAAGAPLTGEPVAFYFISETMYEAMTGKRPGLKSGEVAMCPITILTDIAGIFDEEITFYGRTYDVKTKLDSFPVNDTRITVFSVYGVVMSDEDGISDIYEKQKETYGQDASEMKKYIACSFSDRGAASEKWKQFSDEVSLAVETVQSDVSAYWINFDCYWRTADDVLGMYGTLLFLGIILGLVCMFATVLIIYYKQISEGYEDRKRWQIMKKVGMSSREIEKTVRTQTRFVFFLPLVTAGVHISFAFPIINRMLHVLMLPKTSIYLISTVITFAAFALIYAIIYSMTAKTYAKIVK